MFKSFLTIAIRNIVRDKYFALINVLGLAIGLASCLLIFSYVRGQLSYDNFHHDVDRLYRVNQTAIWNPEGGVMSSTSPPLALTLTNDFAEVEDATRINTPYGQIVRYDDGKEVKAFYEERILAADSNFFSFFGFRLREGNPATALKGVNNVVISSEAAKKFFGDQPAIGKTLIISDKRIPVEVTGVTEKQPENSHFHFDYLLSMYTNPDIKESEWNWIWTQVVTYVKLRPEANVVALEDKFKSMAAKHVAPTFTRFGINYDDFIKDKAGWNFYLQPIQKIHLYSQEIGNRIGSVGDIKYVYIFSAVGLFVMLLAIINFVNLATARAANRAKEVGVKKVLGAQRRSLIVQFQIESILLVLSSSILGLAFMELIRLMIGLWLGVQLPFLGIWKSDFYWFIPLLVIGVGIIAGAYPSFYLTAFRPIVVLKGKMVSGFRPSGLRNVLTVVQFVISIGFIASTIIIYQQLQYFKNEDLGFDRENVLVINHAEKLGSHLESFRNEISEMNGVVETSIAMDVPGRGQWEDVFAREGDDAKYPISIMKVDEHFMAALGMQIVAGKGYENDLPSDINKVLLNETTVRLLGWTPEDALGKKMIYLGDDVGPMEIRGVVKDFHFTSLRNEIAPAIFYHVKSPMYGDNRIIAVKLSSSAIGEILSDIKSKWERTIDDAPFEYSFLKEEWTQKYKDEERLGGLFTLFTSLSIVIAMIGMVGLVTYSAEQRRKEIGIRKALGATVGQMVMLLNGNFTKLIIVSLGLAVPLSWYAMFKWLEQFPYKISINPLVYGLAGIVVLLITWLTVSYQSVKAALTNPSEVLKEE